MRATKSSSSSRCCSTNDSVMSSTGRSRPHCGIQAAIKTSRCSRGTIASRFRRTRIGGRFGRPAGMWARPCSRPCGPSRPPTPTSSSAYLAMRSGRTRIACPMPCCATSHGVLFRQEEVDMRRKRKPTPPSGVRPGHCRMRLRGGWKAPVLSGAPCKPFFLVENESCFERKRPYYFFQKYDVQARPIH